MKIAIGTDHGGFAMKGRLLTALKTLGHRVTDCGTSSLQPCDYPVIGAKVARLVSAGAVERGILLCKSGGGMGIVANRFPRVRAVVCSTVRLARHARQHNDANVLVLGAEQVTVEKALAILKRWLAAPFEGGRHARRIRQIEKIEEKIPRC
ncbi:MAG: ribose 5-phosphate isomerase B [Candidatus Omnitrophica bacterium]|nr:ribose 5-phosphate isomerase B [Candidatus Omnitrophota bacterium]